MRSKLSVPVLIYRNLYYSEPWDASQSVMRMHPDWQLRGADGKPVNPEGKLVYNMSNTEVPAFYTSVVANLSAEVSASVLKLNIPALTPCSARAARALTLAFRSKHSARLRLLALACSLSLALAHAYRSGSTARSQTLDVTSSPGGFHQPRKSSLQQVWAQ